MRQAWMAALAATLLAAAPALAQTNTGTTFGVFTEIEPGARAAAMGNAGVSLFDGIASAYFNPGAVGRVKDREVAFTHIDWIAGISYDYAAVAIPTGGWGVPYVSVTSLNSGDIDVRTVDEPLGTGERYRVSDVAIGLGYARQVSPRFSAGAQVNYIQESIWHTSASAMAFSIGTLYRVSENGLRIGSSLSNFGTHAQYSGNDLDFTYDNNPDGEHGGNQTLPATRSTDPYSVPVAFRVGVAKPYRFSGDQELLLAADALHPNDNTESVSLGAEYTVNHTVALRAGWQNLFLKDTEAGLTAGLGLQGRVDAVSYRCDYAWADQGRLGHSSRLSLGFVF